ncbi:MAG: hypothetical protein AAF221_03375 [Pseudomonadota bacterium]
MTTILTRLYETEAQASEVVSQIKSADFIERRIDVVTMPVPAAPESAEGAAVPPSTSDVLDALSSLGVYASAAKKYAAKMIPGNAVVVVAAPFGGVGRVPAILDASSTIDAGVGYEDVLVEDVRNPTSIIQFTPNRHSIVSFTPKPRPSRPVRPFLGLKTISQPKTRTRRPSNRPLTPGLIISR